MIGWIIDYIRYRISDTVASCIQLFVILIPIYIAICHQWFSISDLRIEIFAKEQYLALYLKARRATMTSQDSPGKLLFMPAPRYYENIIIIDMTNKEQEI